MNVSQELQPGAKTKPGVCLCVCGGGGGGGADPEGAALEIGVGSLYELKSSLPSLTDTQNSQEVEDEEAPDYENL